MEKKNLTKIGQILCLLTFTGMALACSSKKDAIDAIDGFSEGWQLGRQMGLNSESLNSEDDSTMYDLAEENLINNLPVNNDMAMK